MIITPDYRYDLQVVRVIDGDTIDAILTRDIGFRHVATWRQRLRILGIDCPEVTGITRAAGAAATAFTRDWLAAEPVACETIKQDAFGRWLARVFRADGTDLATALIDAGHAIPMNQ
ncbi:MAG: hypothetical protein RL458_1326 [Pseudomonadota bacterium]|jgi:endonuclease YncB( thermonuclease family)